MADDIVINEGVSQKLAAHLQEQGRFGNLTASNIGDSLNRIVNRWWGTAKIPQFRDSSGVGWLIDLSEAFDNEMLYAVVRSTNGQRCVVDVVEETEAAKMGVGGSEQPTESPKRPDEDHPHDDPGTPFPEHIIQRLEMELKAAHSEIEELKPKSVDIALLRWGDPENGKERQIKVGAISGEIRGLIDEGVKPEFIEVWTRCQRPKIRVELE